MQINDDRNTVFTTDQTVRSHWLKASRAILLIMLSSALHVAAQGTQPLKIPDLGSSAGTLFSQEYEYQLGRTWLRLFRSQVRVFEDPMMQNYLEISSMRWLNSASCKTEELNS
jgi:beta-barrel assembly-enhancing protease